MGSLYRQQLESWLKKQHIDAVNVLDVGGGQLPVDKRVGSWSVKNYKLLDNDAQYKPDYFHDLNQPVRFAHTQVDEAIGQKGDGRLYEDDFWMPGAYDAIFCLEVFEYIYDPVTAHRNLGELLCPGGVAYISYPTWYPLHNPPGIDYLRYTKNAIEKLLSVSGFETWEITPRIATDGVKALADFYSKEQMRPMREEPAVFDIGYLVKAYKSKEEV